ncbi:MAG TPA: toxic anion resistance protein, partial [Burkholderiaceae bacterium]|nr:toxic anion resistance protein [Burkholderiaceae bacterium]
EVLFYARQNLQDILTQQAVCVNGYLALDVLKKTGREMMNGCSRVATTGMSALAVAQTVARATGNQIQVMEMLQGVNATIGNLISETGKQLNNHVDATAEFATNPMLGIDKMREMFDQTFKAMDAMDTFRAKAIENMGQNNRIIQEQITRSQQYVDRVRQQQAREAGGAAGTSGPVAL